jgi:hypothetical protein
MKKIDVIQHITTKAITDGVDIICAADEGRPHLPITQCDSFKALIGYLQESVYSIKNCSENPQLIVKNNGYSKLKIKIDERQQLNKFAVISMNDSLEAKLYLDIPILNKEIHLFATRDSKNRYSCTLLSYDGKRVYPEDKNPE